MLRLIPSLALLLLSIATTYGADCDFHATRTLLNYPKQTLISNHPSSRPTVVSYLVQFGSAYAYKPPPVYAFTLQLKASTFQAMFESLPPVFKHKPPRSFKTDDIVAVYRYVLKALALVTEDSLGPSPHLISETELGSGIPTSAQQQPIHLSSATPTYAIGQVHRSLILAEVFMALGFTVNLINAGPKLDHSYERFRYTTPMGPWFKKDLFLEIYPHHQALHATLDTLGSLPILKYLPGRSFLKRLVSGSHWVLDPYGAVATPVNLVTPKSEVYWTANPVFVYTRRTDHTEDALLERTIAGKTKTIQDAIQVATGEDGNWHALDREVLEYLHLGHLDLSLQSHLSYQGLKIAFHAAVLSLPPEQGMPVIQRLGAILRHPERFPTADGAAPSIHSSIEAYATTLIETYIKVHKADLLRLSYLVDVSYPHQLSFSLTSDKIQLFLIPRTRIPEWAQDGYLQATDYTAGGIPGSLEVARVKLTYLGTHRDKDWSDEEYYMYFVGD